MTQDQNNDMTQQESEITALLRQARHLFYDDNKEIEAAGLAIYDDIAQRFGKSSSPSIQELVVKALLEKAKRHALNARKEELDRISRFSPAIHRQKETLKPEELQAYMRRERQLAVETYDRIDQLFGHAQSITIQYLVADALSRKAGLFYHSDYHAGAALDIYEILIKRYSAVPAPEIQSQVASAWRMKADKLDCNGYSAEALVAYDQLIKLFINTADEDIQKTVVLGLIGKAWVQTRQGDFLSAIATYITLEKRFSLSTSELIRTWIAEAQLSKANVLYQHNGALSAINECDKLLKYLATLGSQVQKRVLPQTLLKKAEYQLLEKLPQEAAITYTQVLDYFRPTLQNENRYTFGSWDIQIAALIGSIRTLHNVDQLQTALSSRHNLLEQVDQQPDQALTKVLSKALGYYQLKKLGTTEELVEICDQWIELFCSNPTLALDTALVYHLISQANQQSSDHATLQLMTSLNLIIDNFQNADDASIQKIVHQAFFDKISLLNKQENWESSIATCIQLHQYAEKYSDHKTAMQATLKMIDVYEFKHDYPKAITLCNELYAARKSADKDSSLAQAKALVRKGDMQRKLMDVDAACTTYEELLQQLGHHSDPDVVEEINRALNTLACTRLLNGDLKAAAKAFYVYWQRKTDITEIDAPIETVLYLAVSKELLEWTSYIVLYDQIGPKLIQDHEHIKSQITELQEPIRELLTYPTLRAIGLQFTAIFVFDEPCNKNYAARKTVCEEIIHLFTSQPLTKAVSSLIL